MHCVRDSVILCLSRPLDALVGLSGALGWRRETAAGREGGWLVGVAA